MNTRNNFHSVSFFVLNAWLLSLGSYPCAVRAKQICRKLMSSCFGLLMQPLTSEAMDHCTSIMTIYAAKVPCMHLSVQDPGQSLAVVTKRDIISQHFGIESHPCWLFLRLAYAISLTMKPVNFMSTPTLWVFEKHLLNIGRKAATWKAKKNMKRNWQTIFHRRSW